MYTINFNKSTYNIKLIIEAFGKKTGRTIKKTMRKTSPIRINKLLKKSFATPNARRLSLPWSY